MIIDSIEDIVEEGEVVGKLCTDKAGSKIKVKVGRGGHLKNKWDSLFIGRAYSFKMGEFKGYPFTEDFEEVKDAFVKEAQKQVEDKAVNTRDRSMSASYSKDLVVAGKINLGQMFEWADKFCQYINGGQIDEIKKDIPSKETAPALQPKAKNKVSEKVGEQVREVEVIPIETPSPEVTNVISLMNWAKEKGMMPSQVRAKMGWGLSRITDEMAIEAFTKIKEGG